MFIIKSLGDFIPLDEKSYKIHSRFEKVINFEERKNLVSLVRESVGAGPVNIVVEGYDFKNIVSLKINKNYIFINDTAFLRVKIPLYSSKIEFKNIAKNIFLKNLKTIENYLIENAGEFSCVFLLNGEREKLFKTLFEITLKEKIKIGAKLFLEGLKNQKTLKDGVQTLKGSGFGLTPSGDDFISGALAALFVYENIFKKENLSKKREEVFNLSKSDNKISNTFLYFASKGLFFEKFKIVILSLLYKNEKDLKEKIKDFLEVGETSGGDILTGFVLGIKRFINLKQNMAE